MTMLLLSPRQWQQLQLSHNDKSNDKCGTTVNTATVVAIIVTAAATTSHPMVCGGDNPPNDGKCGSGDGDSNGSGNDKNDGRKGNNGVEDRNYNSHDGGGTHTTINCDCQCTYN
jgi:hypothetical protein